MRLMDHRAADVEFERILRDRDLRIDFQPITHLSSETIIGYEALVRGPEGSRLTSPGALLAAANRAGRLVEFDWAARACACRAALAAEIDKDILLFLNIEPIALESDCPRDLWPDIEQAFNTFRVVLEVTERSLDRDPGTLLDGIERLRPIVAGIALDDVGSRPATLAMLPLVAPTVIKIDLQLVHSPPNPAVAQALNAVHEEVERTGAVLLAEGVETVEHRRRAVGFGAQLAQGRLLGAPAPLPHEVRRPRIVELKSTPPPIVTSPFAALVGTPIGPADEDLLLALTRHIGACSDVTAPTLHVSLLPRRELLEPADIDRLSHLAAQGTFAAVLGRGVPSEPGQGVRGVGQRQEAQPINEWAAITLGPCSGAAVLARRSEGGENTWHYGLTHDRTRTIAAARNLVRLLGAPAPQFRFEE